ncbi:hypothetical protein XO10_06915 [Marinitoga sp. 1135]|uniref:Uncharacterized protein n=1 Tax=Marinitoga piezophila (strain DSM 14283 / JCM 11233 / KA3) TaxID=443254 RepID=H2J3Q8_MARPK|nr:MULTISPECIES: hypothetical protein [Marinitoga]AEX85800.1 hypothetical protein Marpi_1401 [Marinitoga piezophila KA3]APT76241.1 hypothetical protein LN42_07485 [Marinitoga sp. 1137]NUU96000.1 hypothetical protein [Marinitoga sp. 1135]
MKKILILSLLILFAFSVFGDKLLIFRNTGIISKELPWTENFKFSLEKDQSVIFIENAEYYSISFPAPEDVAFRIIGNNEKLHEAINGRVKILNQNPLIIEDTFNPAFIYYFDNNLKMWCKTEKENLNKLFNNKILTAKKIKGLILISTPMKWDIVYDMKDDGTLYATYKISGRLNQEYDTILINENFTQTAKPQIKENYYSKSLAMERPVENYDIPQLINESTIINIGKILPFNGDFNKVVSLGKIKKYEDIQYLTFDFYSGSIKNRYLDVLRRFLNSKENGLGVPLISGDFRIYTKNGKTEFINKVSKLTKTSINDYAEINLGKGWNVKADIILLNEYRTKDYIEKTYRINLTNSSTTTKKFKIKITGYSVNLENIKSNLNNIEKKVFGDYIELFGVIKDKGFIELKLKENIMSY